MKKTQAVGIDLGTTYSCLAWLNEHGHPVTIPNQEGELSTPSVVFFDHDEVVVGTEALRNAIARPTHVVQNAKRFMGHADKVWNIAGARYTPVDVSSLILRKLISAAQLQIGEITEAVITVPAQFSDAQRHATIRAGLNAGLEKVEVINEPVAAALCHVLGGEGLAFTELAIDQQLLVFDLGGGTLDLAVVSYCSDEVRVVASDGDLELGGLDWTQVLVDVAAEKFIQDFGEDPRDDPESHQFLALEAEQAKRSLSVRPRAAITVQHGRNRRTYQVEQAEFVAMSRRLLQRSETITKRILADNGFGWAHVDVVLTTGGASRMPMVRDSLKKLSGRTLNSSLSPDQSIAHGAAYYAGMLLTNQQYVRTVFSSEASTRLAKVRQQSVSARGLGILIRDTASGKRVPHYLIPPNTPLPASKTHVFGTVVARQTKVHVRIVESGAGPGKPHTVLGDCFITDLPPDLPQDSEVEVTISYDHQARVHVTAREPRSGIRAEAEILRQENLSAQLQEEAARNVASAKAERPSTPPPLPEVRQTSAKTPMQQPAAAKRRPSPPSLRKSPPAPPKPKPEPEVERSLSEEWEIVSDRLFDFADFEAPKSEESEQPILLCNACGAPLNVRGRCPECGPLSGSPGSKASGNRGPGATKANRSGAAGAKRRPAKRSAKSPGVKRRRPDADDQHHN